MYGCESWTIRKLSTKELMLLNCGVGEDWTTMRSNQSILKDISPGISLEGMMLKLKLQNFGHLIQRTDSSEKTLMLGKIEARWEGDHRGWNGWMALSIQWTWVWVNSGSWRWTGRPGVLRFLGLQRVIHDWATELNWSEYYISFINVSCATSTIHILHIVYHLIYKALKYFYCPCFTGVIWLVLDT